jgi:acylphosphatase
MDKTVRITVTGKVQGVGFRWCSYEKFVELGLAGSAENGSDGSVEITATGDTEKLKEFLRWAQKGPDGARVKEMKYEVVESMLEGSSDESGRS